jgi:hypothetical protein
MLPSVTDLTNQLKTLPPENNSLTAATNFVNVLSAFMNQVQAGSLGTPGIFTYNNAIAIPLIAALPPVPDNSWITNFANAIHAGSTAATLTAGTVTDPAWTSSGVDVLPPSITTLPAALSTLTSELSSVTSSNNPPQPLAQAIHDYTTAFTFLCTGLVTTGGGPIPLPLSFPAE